MPQRIHLFFQNHKRFALFCGYILLLCKPFIWIYKLIVFIFRLVLKIKDMFCLPFLVIKKENTFLSWIFIVALFAPLASYLPFVNGFTDESYTSFSLTFTNMYVLTLCLSLLAPLFAEIGLNLYVSYKMGKDAKLIGILMFHMILSFIFICLITIYFCTKNNLDYTSNIKISYITIAYAFLLYCISKMFTFQELLKYGTKTYTEEEDDRCKQTINKLNKVSSAKIGDQEVSV